MELQKLERLLATPLQYRSTMRIPVRRAQIGLLLARLRRPQAIRCLDDYYKDWMKNRSSFHFQDMQRAREACDLPPLKVVGNIDTFRTPILEPLYQEPGLTKL